MTKRTIRELANSEEQIASSMYLQIRRIFEKCPKSALRFVSEDGSNYRLTPSPRKRFSEINAFSVAELLQQGKPTGIYYLVINDNLLNVRLQFGKWSLDKAIYDPTETGIEYSIDGLQDILDRIEGAVDQTRIEKNLNRQKYKNRFTAIVGVAAGAVLIGGGFFGIIYSIMQGNEHERAAAEQYARDYDMRNININGVRIDVGRTSWVSNDPKILWDEVPALVEISPHPRVVSIESDECTSIGRINPDEYVVIAAEAPEQDVMAGVDSNGWVNVCPDAVQLPPGAKQSDPNDDLNVRVIVQSRPVQK